MTALKKILAPTPKIFEEIVNSYSFTKGLLQTDSISEAAAKSKRCNSEIASKCNETNCDEIRAKGNSLSPKDVGKSYWYFYKENTVITVEHDRLLLGPSYCPRLKDIPYAQK